MHLLYRAYFDALLTTHTENTMKSVWLDYSLLFCFLTHSKFKHLRPTVKSYWKSSSNDNLVWYVSGWWASSWNSQSEAALASKLWGFAWVHRLTKSRIKARHLYAHGVPVRLLYFGKRNRSLICCHQPFVLSHLGLNRQRLREQNSACNIYTERLEQSCVTARKHSAAEITFSWNPGEDDSHQVFSGPFLQNQSWDNGQPDHILARTI